MVPKHWCDVFYHIDFSILLSALGWVIVYHHLPALISQSHLAGHAGRDNCAVYSDLSREGQQPALSFSGCLAGTTWAFDWAVNLQTRELLWIKDVSREPTKLSQNHCSRGTEEWVEVERIWGPRRSGTRLCLLKQHSCPSPSTLGEEHAGQQQVLGMLNTQTTSRLSRERKKCQRTDNWQKNRGG